MSAVAIKRTEADGSWLLPATVAEVLGEGQLSVRLGTRLVSVRTVDLPGYQPSVGDRLLIAGDGGDAYAIGVLDAARPRALVSADGSRAELNGRALELYDPGGNLLVRCVDGDTEVTAARRDLKLSAPHGRVVVQAATDVTIEAARDLSQEAGRNLSLGVARQELSFDSRGVALSAAKAELSTGECRVATGQATLLAKAVATTAERVSLNTARYDVYAEKLVERARDSVREVSGLAEATIGRARTLVRGVFTLRSRRSVLLSQEETTIDGERILLG